MRCDFEMLVRYLDKQLDVDRQLAVLNHLDRCDTCRDAVYQIVFDRDAHLFLGPCPLGPCRARLGLVTETVYNPIVPRRARGVRAAR